MIIAPFVIAQCHHSNLAIMTRRHSPWLVAELSQLPW